MSTLFDALIKISTDLAETGLLVMDSAMRAAQGGIESLAGQRPAGPLTEPPVEGPRDLDSAISDLANRTARIARFTPCEIESAPRAVTEFVEAARRSFSYLDWKDPRNLLLPMQIPLSIGTIITAMGLRGLSSLEIIGLRRYPTFLSHTFEMFTEVQIYVSVQYPAVVKRYRERVQRVPEDSAARVELGKALTKCGRYVEAARELRLAAQDPVVRAQALHECAVANYRAGNFQQAVADGSAAKAANPENGRMRSFLWLSAQRMGGYPPEVPPEHRMEMKVGYEKPTVEFEDIDSKIGLDKTSAGRGVAVFDYNNDGHLDVVIAADFIDYPLNNRWWLEDEFKKVRGLPSEAAKVKRLRVIARWEHPGPGSFYDNVGNASKAPHVLPGETEPTFWWWDEGKSRARLSWQATMWPRGVVYEGLDPEASYIVRTSGYGQAPLRINGDRVEPVLDGKEMGEFKEFIVPRESLKDRRLVLTWDRPDERALNWRKRSRLSEVWLLKKE